jgi:hypothetical protein
MQLVMTEEHRGFVLRGDNLYVLFPWNNKHVSALNRALSRKRSAMSYPVQIRLVRWSHLMLETWDVVKLVALDEPSQQKLSDFIDK